MKRTRPWRAVGVMLAIAGFLVSMWGVGKSAARPNQEHDGDHDHPTTTTAPGSPTTQPPTTQPPDIGPRPAAERTTTVRYGNINLPAPPPTSDGKHGHAMTGNQFMFGLQKPCSDCYITGMIPNLVDPATGATVGIRDNVMLHHMVMLNQNDGHEDATCQWGFPIPLGGLFGQRFFASGDERTPLVMQPGNGYYVGNGTWNMIYDLMTMATTAKNVSFEVKFLWIPASQAGTITKVEPVWFDVNQCGTSEVSVPAGVSTKSWTWTVNRPGKIIGIGGHIHNGGVNVDIRNDSTGQVICNSVARYGETPLYVDHHGEPWVSSMSTCGGAPQPSFAAPIANGQRITITGHYNMPEAVSDQMAIAIAYVAPDRACSWWEHLFGLC